MGSVQIRQKASNSVNLNDQPKTTLTLKIDVNAPLQTRLKQLTNWSFSEIKEAFKTFQRINESPMLDSFLFHKMGSFSRKNSDLIFYEFSNGQKYVSVYELLGMLILTSYQTYRSKLQLIYLLYDLDQSGMLHGRELILIFESMVFGFCRMTGQEPPLYANLSKFSKANFFPGEEIQFSIKEVNLRRLIDEYEGNREIAQLFNRFEQTEFKEIKEDFGIFSKSGLKRYDKDEIEKAYRIIYKAYSKGDYEEIVVIENNKEFRRQNRRDSCYKKILEEKQTLFTGKPLSLSSRQFHTLQTQKSRSTFRLKKVTETSKRGSPTSKLLFLKGQTYSKKDIFGTISYFKALSESEDVIRIKEFFKRFDKKAFLKKQISSIFKFLDGDKKGEITLIGFFKSFYPGINQSDYKLLKKWLESYQETYEADSLARNQPKVIVMSDARALPTETLERFREIFKALDMGNKGYLNFQDLRKAYRVGFTADEIEKMLRDYGTDNMIGLGGLCKMLLPVGWEIEGVDLGSLR